MPAEPSPRLRLTGDDPSSPEAVYIGTLLESGQYTPEIHRITPAHFSCFGKLHDFCVDYQQRSGQAPPIGLVTKMFPTYEVVHTGVSPEWAASSLSRAYGARELRQSLRKVASALADDDLDEAYTLLDSLDRPRAVRKPPADIFDSHVYESEFALKALQVPHLTLGRVSGGIFPGDLWYLAGRPGTGKTWNLCQYAALAATHGARVRYLSLEMRAARISLRAMSFLAKPAERVELNSGDPKRVKVMLDDLKDRVSPGTISVVDPSHGRITTTVVREYMDDCDLLVVDHAGLLFTHDGRRAVDDWRAMATVSNMLKEYALETNIPVLAGAQINRAGDTGGTKPPKLRDLAQSDALGQDADVVVTMKRMSKHVMVQSAEKVREGEGRTWYSAFDPEKMDFTEISKDTAMERRATDDDFEADD